MRGGCDRSSARRADFTLTPIHRRGRGRETGRGLVCTSAELAGMQGPRQRTEQASPLWRAPQGLRGPAGLLCVPVGGGPPARSPHASLTARSGRSRSPARPRHRPRAPQPGLTSTVFTSNQAGRCGPASQAACWLLITWPRRRPRAPQPGLTNAVSTFNQAAWCPVRARERGSRHTNGADPKGPAPLLSRDRTRGRRCRYMPPRIVATRILPTMATG